jgi:hypothetical protein
VIETRHHVRFLYPGSFFPEESGATRIAESTTEAVLAVSPDGRWFAAEIVTAEYERFASDDGAERWLPTPTKSKKKRIIIGQKMTSADVAAMPGDRRILLSNMRGNGWDPVVRTRCGNFQPIEDGDVVLAPETYEPA